MCFAAAASVASSAGAQTPSPEDIASARAMGTEGVRLAESGNCAAAIAKLESAEKLYHAPTTLERLGECHVNLGHLVAGTEILNRVVRETLSPNAPAAFVAAQSRGAQVLASAQPRIGKLRIHVEGAPVETVTVTVDGAHVPPALFDADRATDPGTHEVTATAPGHKPVTATVQLSGGAALPVSLKLEASEASAPEASAGAPATPPPVAGGGTTAPTSEPSSSPGRVPAFIALGIGGAGVVVGTLFGVMALGTKSSLDGACTDKVCPGSSQSDINALSTRATIANVGFAVGLVGVGVGTVLLVLGHGGDAQRPTAAVARPRVQWTPWLGARSAGLEGTFE
jgi:hypothetical protein